MLRKKVICICRDVYKIYEGKDFDEIFEVLSKLENKQLKIEIKIVCKYKNLDEELEQNHTLEMQKAFIEPEMIVLD